MSTNRLSIQTLTGLSTASSRAYALTDLTVISMFNTKPGSSFDAVG